jgi:hypothetical protein
MKEKPRIADVILFVFFAMTFSLWSFYALADTFSAQGSNGKLTLKKKPCSLGPWFKVWLEADWLYKGKPYKACWRVQRTQAGQDVVIVIDSSGVVSDFDAREFKQDEPI